MPGLCVHVQAEKTPEGTEVQDPSIRVAITNAGIQGQWEM